MRKLAGIVLVAVLAAGAIATIATIDGGDAPPPQRSPQPSAAPSPSPEPPLAPAVHPVIAAAGDIACDPSDKQFNQGRGTSFACAQLATSELLVGRDLDAVLLLGDLQYENGALAKFRRSYDPSWGRLKDIAHPVPGNHDYGVTGARDYFDYFGEAAGERGKGYYSFDIGAWHIIALNSNCWAVGGCARGSLQERWLRADLASHRGGCALAFWHHPRFSSGAHGNDTTYDAFWRALYDGGADVVLNGHDHTYERFRTQDPDARFDPERGIREFVVGTGGRNTTPFLGLRRNSEIRRTGSFGVLELTLRPDGYDFRFLPIEREAFTDAGSGKCH